MMTNPKHKVAAVYLDGKVEKAELIHEKNKSFGVFIHSLILSNYSAKSVGSEPSSQIHMPEHVNETAISLFTASQGFDKTLIDSIAPKVGQLPDPSRWGIEPSIFKINQAYRVITKGCPSEILSQCSYVMMDLKAVKITRKRLRNIYNAFVLMTEKGLRVIALAIKDLTDLSHLKNNFEAADDMTLVALVGIE